MFRSLLTFLVALPLLLPQGVCVCDFMQKCEACADCTVSVEADKPACGCRKHKQEKPLGDSPTIAAGHTCHKPISPEKRNDHLPGCPAKEGSAVWKADTTQPLVVVSLGLVGLVNGLELPAAISAPPAPSTYLRSGDRPIYLTLLTLRI